MKGDETGEWMAATMRLYMYEIQFDLIDYLVFHG